MYTTEKRNRLRLSLSDRYPRPVRDALLNLAVIACSCDEAVEYVLRAEREAFAYFRSLKHRFGQPLEHWLAGQPERVSRLEQIKRERRVSDKSQ